MIKTFAFTKILGLPIIAWGGLTTLILLLATATVGFLTTKNIVRLPFSLHLWLARITIVFALVHGFLGIISFINL